MIPNEQIAERLFNQHLVYVDKPAKRPRQIKVGKNMLKSLSEKEYQKFLEFKKQREGGDKNV